MNLSKQLFFIQIGTLQINYFRPKHILELLKSLKGTKQNTYVDFRMSPYTEYFEEYIFGLFRIMYKSILADLIKESIFSKVEILKFKF